MNDSPMPPVITIAVLGAGAIGCYIGGLAAAQGHAQLRFIGRARYRDMLAEHGLSLSHFERGVMPVDDAYYRFSLEADEIASADVVLLCVKSQDTIEAAQTLATYIRPNTLVISLQNGIGNQDVIEKELRKSGKANRVLGAVVPFNVMLKSPGIFHCGTEGNVMIANDDHENLPILIQALNASGHSVELSDNIRAVQWGKLIVNLNNALNALSGDALRAGLMERPYRRALAMMIEEAIAILSAAREPVSKFGKQSHSKMITVLRLPDRLYNLIANMIVKIDPHARSSMLDDLESGRDCEINYLQGEIVRLAAQQGMRAPINAYFLQRVEQAFMDGQSPKLSGQQIYDEMLLAISRG